jgi:8-oxo-dGTP pyrophosphatase MutT (NUDIX family)
MDRFCKFCGCEHTATAYPMTCDNCEQITWINPIPVAVLLQPVVDGNGRIGILVGRRTIEPCVGTWNLPGGYMSPDDQSVIIAARREFLEETGFEPVSGDMRIVSSMCDGRVVLSFVQANEALPLSRLDDFVPNDECDAIRVAWRPELLSFSSHTAALRAFFADPVEQPPSIRERAVTVWPAPRWLIAQEAITKSGTRSSYLFDLGAHR